MIGESGNLSSRSLSHWVVRSLLSFRPIAVLRCASSSGGMYEARSPAWSTDGMSGVMETSDDAKEERLSAFWSSVR